ncbi:thiamine phosphate synthase, partial [Pectobacterium brasiliense]|uniref:thiamine phosphate synthase n=1 Tax=Pectobacterium brasiliense TaxID=180957 RepID=UPI003985B956
ADLTRHITALQGRCPTVAIGGISIVKLPAVLKTGVGSIAVVSAITQAADWLQASATLLSMLEGREA